MGPDSLGDSVPPATSNSAKLDFASIDNDAGAVGEPLVEDVDQMQSDAGASTHIGEQPQTPHKMTEPPQSPINFRPLTSHPVNSSSDEDAAQPPPDLTRRGIHIPTRTRYAS